MDKEYIYSSNDDIMLTTEDIFHIYLLHNVIFNIKYNILLY